jgi:hypothetical protein
MAGITTGGSVALSHDPQSLTDPRDRDRSSRLSAAMDARDRSPATEADARHPLG